jgi:hypothetical protein
MAIITSLAKAATTRPVLDVGPYGLKDSFALTATISDNADVIELFSFPRAGTVYTANLAISATLGASATMKLVVGDGTTNVDLTTATTAGGASKVNGTTVGPISFAAGAKVYLLNGGADVSAAATATTHLLVQHD